MLLFFRKFKIVYYPDFFKCDPYVLSLFDFNTLLNYSLFLTIYTWIAFTKISCKIHFLCMS